MFASLHVSCVFVLFNIFWRGHADFFSSTAVVEDLFETRERIIKDLNIYVNEGERRLALIKRVLELYKRGHEIGETDISNYVENPVNAFTLIKRLTIDLDHIRNIIKTEPRYMKQILKNHKDMTYPEMKDLEGAATGLIRLQQLYNLNATELAAGKLNGVVESTVLTASDCYELGRVVYDDSDFLNALRWFEEAYSKYMHENIPYPFNGTDIVEYIISAHFLGNITKAQQWVHKILDVTHKQPRNVDLIKHLHEIITEESKLTHYNEAEDENQNNIMKEMLKIYNAMCRGELEVPSKESSRLICRYMTEKHPFLKIAPIKMEMMYLDPDIVLFHDVISDNEIETVKQMTLPYLKRSTVQGKDKNYVSESRVSKQTWLFDSDSATVARISRRVSHMTGLNLETAEPLQVANYGIGGRYDPHYDCVMMSDVAQGGATVFPVFGLRVAPVKGTALFWTNMHASGEGNYAMVHAACPVLQGSKWVGNKWIPKIGQELVNPCRLNDQYQRSIRDLPQPVYKPPREGKSIPKCLSPSVVDKQLRELSKD